jgi:hypothetical protein
VISKLGYGAYSTVWLAWDERFQLLLIFYILVCCIALLLTFNLEQKSIPH